MLFQKFILVPTHPLFWCTCAFIAGVAYGGNAKILPPLPIAFSIMHDYIRPLFACLLSIGFVACCMLLILKRFSGHFWFTGCEAAAVDSSHDAWSLYVSAQKYIIGCSLLTICFCGGIIRSRSYIHYHQSLKRALYCKPLGVVARVMNIEITRSKAFKTRLDLQLTSFVTEGDQKKISACLRIFLIKQPKLAIGDIIHIHSVRCDSSIQPSYQRNLYKEGFVSSLYRPSLNYKIVKHPRWCFSRYRAALQKKMARTFSQKLSPNAAALFSPLFLGIPASGQMQDIRKLHNQWGIVHFLARSGLHVMLLAASWNYLLRCIPINYFIKQLLLLLFVILYHLLTFPSISFLRALITFVLYKICVIQNVSYQPLHILSLTTLGVLVVNPLQLFFLDFQLSFGLTFALAWFNEVRLRQQRAELIAKIAK